MQDKDKDRKLLTIKDVIDQYGPPFSKSFLVRKRMTGTGPRYLKTGKGRTAKIYYRRQDIDEWIEKSMRTVTTHGKY